ncbi:hypothetical protein HPB52_019073 [Rhipicephalus sanguineus]|uniref:Uncharacterized protein n=1 Tax=Rhipicephalus sanguineus TaxID=34632 RepID=A0A9D4PLX7_RHISA|nr:hypothetical protein HPB52_019073 [Rhipicephalus sanguineus]
MPHQVTQKAKKGNKCGAFSFTFCGVPKHEFYFDGSQGACLSVADLKGAALCNRGANKFTSLASCDAACGSNANTVEPKCDENALFTECKSIPAEAGESLWTLFVAGCFLVTVCVVGAIVFYIVLLSRSLGDAFLCTTSLGLVSIAVPPDGVCDYMFFDSLYTNNTFKLIDKAPTGELKTYLTAANSSQRTVHGVGINVRYTHDVRMHLKTREADSKNFLEALLSNKIVGFGVLSISKNQFSHAVFDTAIAALSGCDGVDQKALARNVTSPFAPLTGLEGAQIDNVVTNKYLVFDNADSLVRKYCKGTLDLPGTKFGLAAYDVNYDSGVSTAGVCEPTFTKIGNFVRVNVMRKMRDAFRNVIFRSVDDCVNAFAP